jgi:hypothetical protein
MDPWHQRIADFVLSWEILIGQRRFFFYKNHWSKTDLTKPKHRVFFGTDIVECNVFCLLLLAHSSRRLHIIFVLVAYVLIALVELLNSNHSRIELDLVSDNEANTSIFLSLTKHCAT